MSDESGGSSASAGSAPSGSAPSGSAPSGRPRRRGWPTVVLLLQLASAAAVGADDPSTVERRWWLMGTILGVTLEGSDRHDLLVASESVLAAVQEAEALLSTWRSDTPLSRLNSQPAGVALEVPARLEAALEEARACWLATAGAFDPGAGGPRPVSPSDSTEGELGAGDEGREPGAGLDQLERLGDGLYRRRSGRLRIDSGGFGKGVALDLAIGALTRQSAVERARLDFGGQIAVYRRRPSATGVPTRPFSAAARGPLSPWELDVGDPLKRRRAVLRLRLEAGEWASGSSVATSGTVERGLHIYDPRRGRPAADFGSLTVIAPSGLWADCLSTGLYVLGPEEALRYAVRHDPLEVVVLTLAGDELIATVSPGLRDRARTLVDDLRLEMYRGDGSGSTNGATVGAAR